MNRYRVVFRFKPEFIDSYNMPLSSNIQMTLDVEAESEAHAGAKAMLQAGTISNNVNEWKLARCDLHV